MTQKKRGKKQLFGFKPILFAGGAALEALRSPHCAGGTALAALRSQHCTDATELSALRLRRYTAGSLLAASQLICIYEYSLEVQKLQLRW